MTQTKYKLDKVSLIKTLKGAGIAGGGVFVLYVMTWLSGGDYGVYTPLLTGLFAVIINFLHQWQKGVKV